MCRPKWFVGCGSKHFWDDPAEARNTLYSLLYRIARHRGIPEPDAHDLVSEVITEHWKRFPALPEGSNPVAYARIILRNRIADWYAGRGQQPPTEELEVLETSRFHLTERLLTYREEEERKVLLQAIQVALAHCPEQDKQVIDLRFWKGLTHPEIATLLGEPEGTVKSRFSRALQRIKKEVLGNDIR